MVNINETIIFKLLLLNQRYKFFTEYLIFYGILKKLP